MFAEYVVLLGKAPENVKKRFQDSLVKSTLIIGTKHIL